VVDRDRKDRDTIEALKTQGIAAQAPDDLTVIQFPVDSTAIVLPCARQPGSCRNRCLGTPGRPARIPIAFLFQLFVSTLQFFICSFFAVHCSFFAVHCSLFIVHCSLFTFRFSFLAFTFSLPCLHDSRGL